MLKLTKEKTELGTVQFNQPKIFEVGVENTGENDVMVTRIQPGCGSCTTASMASTLIKPGTIEKIKVVYTPTSFGFSNKRVTITSSDGTLILFFTATVV